MVAARVWGRDDGLGESVSEAFAATAGESVAPAGARVTALLSQQARRHVELRRKVLRTHPEAVELIGREPLGVFAALIILAVHWTAAWAISYTNVFWVFVAAFFIGQVTIHSA